jgi:hypothetical protein
MEAYGRIGSQWFMIAHLLPGRSKNSIKNRFLMLARRSQNREQQEEGKTEIEETDPFPFLRLMKDPEWYEWENLARADAL